MTDTKYTRKVVLAVDGSEHSQRAFNWYWNNLVQKGDLLLVFHAFEMPRQVASGPYPYGATFYEEWSNLVRQADDEAKHLLENYGRECKARIASMPEETRDLLHFKLFKETGKPGEVICKFTKDEHAHLIIMGSRGLGTLRRTFLGSNSDFCVHHAHIPVAVIPPVHPHPHVTQH